MKMKTISFVIAVYHNEIAVTKTYEKIHELFKTQLSNYDFNINFVDDGSTDNSLNELLALRERDKRVRIITFTRNFGQNAAMLAGFRQADGDAVVNVSADLQDPIELVEQMVAQWEAGSETVICHRIKRNDRLTANLMSRLAYRLLRLSFPQIPSGGFDFVLMDRKVMEAFNRVENRNRFFQGDLLWTGYRTSFIPYERQARRFGKSQYNFWKKLRNFADAILDASYLPIRFISFIGIMTSIGGFIYTLTVILSWMLNATPFTGWAPLMMAILIIGGLIMTMLGIIGEYIWRIYDDVRGKPTYIIREKFCD